MPDEGREPPAAPAQGVVGSVKGLLDTLLGIVQVRLQLLGNELQEEALRLRRIAYYGIGAAFFVSLGVFFGTLAAILAFWEHNIVGAVAVFAAVYGALGIAMFLYVRRLSTARTRLFDASIAELKKDKDRLQS
jgi:uncharacterized membrane protein YqjE